MEWLLLSFGLAFGLLPLLIRPGSERRTMLGLAVGVAVVVVVAATMLAPAPDRLPESLPGPREADPESFVTSATCRSCHPAQHASWHHSFHRSMTMPATPANVLGDFDDVTLESRGHVTRLWREGDEFWAESVDPRWLFATIDVPVDQLGEAPRIRARVVMTTGSHHLQSFWMRPATESGLDDGTLLQSSWVWSIAESRWIPTQDSFLTPPSDRLTAGTPWHVSCSMCHSVATQPGVHAQVPTRTAELGIACEACHGPGGEHVRTHRSPLARYLQHLRPGAADPTIVNPARLSANRSAMVCGQCHSFQKELDMDRWAQLGVTFRPGDDIAATKGVFAYTETPQHPRLVQHLEDEPDALSGRFWRDGTIRIAGREYSGLIESACHTEGEMSCLSCHSMHDYRDRSDQLVLGASLDTSCIDCHAEIASEVTAHSHHRPGSPGASCVNCHMPHTTWGLFTAMRSHRIDSPSARVSAETGRPNACNQCHLDRPLAWTADRLTEWYGQPTVTLDADDRDIAASVLWVIRGDAVQRAIAAWTMGWKPAQQVSGVGWQGALLATALVDPYAAVRNVAGRSIRTLPGFDAFAYDWLPSGEFQQQAARDAVSRWGASRAHLDRRGRAVLIGSLGVPDDVTIGRLMKERDNTRLRIIE